VELARARRTTAGDEAAIGNLQARILEARAGMEETISEVEA
jgi:hypothetical protein